MDNVYRMPVKRLSPAVVQALRTGRVRLNWVTLADLRKLIAAGFMVSIVKGK